MLKKILLVVTLVVFGTVSYAEPIVTDSTSTSTVNTTNTSTVQTTPPSAVSPSINSSNGDLCTVGQSGAVQTQILGISGGSTIRDMNCERLKLSKTLYDMGMKVAAVSVMCQDRRVFDAMMMAGTPCPYEGTIGTDAAVKWAENPQMTPEQIIESQYDNKNSRNGMVALGVLVVLGALVAAH